MSRRVLRALGMTVGGMLAAEGVVYLLLSFSFCVVPTASDYRCRRNFGLVSRSMASFNAETGYKWLPGEARIVRVANGVVAYDNVFSINNAGYHSSRDYRYEKEEGDYRIVVLGDSFTNEIHQRPWPDRLHELLNYTDDGYEVHSFGVDGGGAVNWHRIFFHEIEPRYEFDALLIAIFTDNLERSFTVFHSTDDALFFGRFGDAPRSEEDFVNSYLPEMTAVADVVDDATIDSVVTKVTTRAHSYRFLDFDFHLTRYLYRRAVGSFREQAAAPLETDPRETMSMLGEIIESCRASERPVVLSAIPSREGLVHFLADESKNRHQYEIESIAKRFGVLFFDGYGAFRGIEPEEIVNDYWLRYDGHWNQRASDLYARKLSEFLLRNLSEAGAKNRQRARRE